MSEKPAIPKLKFDCAIANLESPDTITVFMRDKDLFLHEVVILKSKLEDIPVVPISQPLELERKRD